MLFLHRGKLSNKSQDTEAKLFTPYICVCSVVTMDSACSSKTAAGNAVRLHIEEEVDAFIGPPCSVGQSKSDRKYEKLRGQAIAEEFFF